MPANSDFRVDILIAGVPVPEYSKDGKYYVECNLNTPFTYKEKASEYVCGEREEQEYPVTPYQIKLTALSGQDFPNYYRVRVDGIKVKGLSLNRGESRRIKGFRDGTSVRELLFSMPRFARDVEDRVTVDRRCAIGTIEIECWMASLQTRRTEMRVNKQNFQQANKKDSSTVTKGNYTMATSRVGKVVCERSFARTVDSWRLISLLSNLTIHYHMPEYLREMGFHIQQPKFQVSSKRSTYGINQPLKRKIKDEHKEGFIGRKLRKKRGNKVNSEKQEEAAKTLLDLQQSVPSPQPGPSMRGAELASDDDDDDDIEIVDVIQAHSQPSLNKKPEPDLIDLTDKDIIELSAGSTAVSGNVQVKEEDKRHKQSGPKKGDGKKSSRKKGKNKRSSGSAEKAPPAETVAESQEFPKGNDATDTSGNGEGTAGKDIENGSKAKSSTSTGDLQKTVGPKEVQKSDTSPTEVTITTNGVDDQGSVKMNSSNVSAALPDIVPVSTNVGPSNKDDQPDSSNSTGLKETAKTGSSDSNGVKKTAETDSSDSTAVKKAAETEELPSSENANKKAAGSKGKTESPKNNDQETIEEVSVPEKQSTQQEEETMEKGDGVKDKELSEGQGETVPSGKDNKDEPQDKDSPKDTEDNQVQATTE